MTEQEQWNSQVEHPLQSWEWGEFRQQTGVKVVRKSGIQVTIHPLPHTPWYVGYAPKIARLDQQTITTIKEIAQENNCIMVKVEPKIEKVDFRFESKDLSEWGLVAGRPMFTKYNFVLDVTPTESELLASFKQKTRYNIKLAEKKGVTVEINETPEAIKRYWELTEETTKRQGFYAHSRSYHQKMWEVLHNAGMAHLLAAKYQGEIITTWVLFKFRDTLYYPYGASTREYREVMANNLVMWETIKLAKQWKCKYLDMWGALGPDPDPSDPWYGFHNFKAGYNPRAVEYIGSWDYVDKPWLYKLYRLIEVMRWKWLAIRKSS